MKTKSLKIKSKLNAGEKQLLASVERDEWQSVAGPARAKKRAQIAAKVTLRKDARVNIRLPAYDLSAIKSLAVSEGLPYQTLMASILHKYATGKLVNSGRS